MDSLKIRKFLCKFLLVPEILFRFWIIFVNYYIERRNCRFCHFYIDKKLWFVILVLILNVSAIKREIY